MRISLRCIANEITVGEAPAMIVFFDPGRKLTLI
jgi:hypothetical protein